MEKQQSAGETINDQKKEWYKNGWGILVAVLIFPYFLLWYMWAKTDWSKNVKWVITVIFVIVNISALAGNATEQQAPTTAQPAIAEKPVQQLDKQATQETKQKTPAVPEKPLSTQDKLWNALDTSMKTRTDYDVKYDETKKEVTLVFSPKDFWDENSIVKGSYSTLVKYGKEAFQIEGVNSLTVNYKLEFTDKYGKKSFDDAVIITMSKDEFNKFDWNNLNYQPVYTQIKSSASKYYIHPAIEGKLDYTKLYLAI